MNKLPEHGPCFVCGTENPHSIGIEWYAKDGGVIYGKITLTVHQQGPPSHSHGGATASLVDEAMGFAVWYAGHRVLARTLTVEYMKPVPLGVEITVTGEIVKKEGKAVHTYSEITLPNGEVAVTGRGTYVEATKFFENHFPRLGIDD
jgi:uncharacterized protein (TIGR00369 family)